MQIDAIEEISKERSRVKLDTGETFVLYKGEFRLLKLKQGSELSEETYNQIKNVVLPKRAKLRCLNLLKSRAYTEYQLRKKLIDGGYPLEVIDIAIKYVKSFGYIDDYQYSLDFINQECKKHSRKEIYLKLSQKGINKEVLDSAFYDTYGSYKDAEPESSFDEISVIKKALSKRHYTGEETYEERQKLLAYFYRRGFDMDVVHKAMDSMFD